jgi:hypothetical protein
MVAQFTAVFCKNFDAHPLGHYVPVERFEKTAKVRCDLCGMSFEYRSDSIVLRPVNGGGTPGKVAIATKSRRYSRI